MDKCDEKDIEIRNVRTIMQKNDETIHTMEQLIGKILIVSFNCNFDYCF